MKVGIFLIIFILLLPYTHAFIVEEREKKYAYDVSTDIEFIKPHMRNIHILNGNYLGMWNATTINISGNIVHGNFKLVEGFGNFTVAFGNTIDIYSYSGGELEKIYEMNESIVPDAMNLVYPYFAMSHGEKTEIVNMKNNTKFIFEMPSEKILIREDHFYTFSGKSLYFINFTSVIWRLDFNNTIRNIAVDDSGIYVMFPHTTSLVQNGKIVGEYPVGGWGIFLSKRYIFVENGMTDDEGKKYWFFSLYTYNFSLLFSHILYLEPKNIYMWGNRLIVFDGKYTHILNETSLIYRSSARESSFLNDSMIYLLENGTLEKLSLQWRIVDSGEDYDGDWILDKYDEDDDNDGMPDWWEEKYHLNPHDASDANKDYDDDGLTNYQEYLNHTNPWKWDTDGDGLSDGYEVSIALSPISKDTDGDGFDDGWELKHGMNPRISDGARIDNMIYSPIIFIILIILIFAGIKRIKKMEKSLI